MPDVTITSDGVIERVAANAANAPSWMPKLFTGRMFNLGNVIQFKMQQQIEGNKYTGGLSSSIKFEIDEGAKRLTVGPTLKRGRWDAGLLLEMGVPHPIPNAPWAPIKAWAIFRGLPPFPIWYTIRTKGIKAHPFINETLERVRPDIQAAADDVGMLAAAAIIETG